MEHIYTIKVKRQFDPRGLYPSERRYSASTVLGLSCVHLALAFTALLLACLVFSSPSNDERDSAIASSPPYLDRNYLKNIEDFEEDDGIVIQSLNDTLENDSVQVEDFKIPDSDITSKYNGGPGYSLSLVLAPCLLGGGSMIAGLAALLASRRWYVDRNIAWFFLASLLSSAASMAALAAMVSWIATSSVESLGFSDYFSDGNLFGKVKVVSEDSQNIATGNRSWFYLIKVPVDDLKSQNIPLLGQTAKNNKTRSVLSINILIAAVVELLWSLLSLKVAWDGMWADYPDDESLEARRGGATLHVVTEIKGNNTKHLPKNTKILPPEPDLIEHHPKSNKIKKFFRSQQENGGFFLNRNADGRLVFSGAKENKNADFLHRESSEEYRERMLNFLNRCADVGEMDIPESNAGIDPADSEIPSPIPPEVPLPIEENMPKKPVEGDRLSSASWGDVHDHTIYDQNTLDLNKIMIGLDTLRKTKIDAMINPQDEVVDINTNSEIIPDDSDSTLEGNQEMTLKNIKRVDDDRIDNSEVPN